MTQLTIGVKYQLADLTFQELPTSCIDYDLQLLLKLLHDPRAIWSALQTQ